jgi:hypothetical protein
MKPETVGKIKTGGWGLFGGAIVAIVIGFGWGGWSTAATSDKMSAEAVVASQAAICVAQFMNMPNHAEKLGEFEQVSTYNRPQFIEEGGWNKMPGQEKGTYSVARSCAEGLSVLIQK